MRQWRCEKCVQGDNRPLKHRSARSTSVADTSDAMFSMTFFDVAFGTYIIGAASLMLVLLFGESTAMQGTVVERAHAFITGGCWEML